jgi:hypothetical protein
MHALQRRIPARSVIVWLVMLVLALVVSAPAAGAQEGNIEPSAFNQNTNGDQTITWTSSFNSITYTEGDTLFVPVSWEVDCGATDSQDSVRLRGDGFTPGGQVFGTDPVVEASTDSSVLFSFAFTQLHQPGRRAVAKGNGQFLVDVGIDQDCDGVVDGEASLGVNVHVASGESEPE